MIDKGIYIRRQEATLVIEHDENENTVADVRRFNRFFTRRIGVLREGLLHSPYPLAEARILFEIAHTRQVTASELARSLGLDPGYLSRIVAQLEQQGLVQRERSSVDARQRLISLTHDGEGAFQMLDERSRDEVRQMLGPLSDGDQRRLVDAMTTIQSILNETEGGLGKPFLLRHHEPGDMGWVVQRHGALYQREYGWDSGFEALVARIVADFIDGYDPAKERCWIAEIAGRRVGCVFLVRESHAVAKLRLLLVEPEARGVGLGSCLVETCVRFARQCGYTTLTLWTNSVLDVARHIYEAQGFTLVEEDQHHSFGKDLVGQNWELAL